MQGLGRENRYGQICSDVEGGLGKSKNILETGQPVRRPWKDSRCVKAMNAVDLGACEPGGDGGMQAAGGRA